MRVLVPYSGSGTNSTYGMYRLLTETDHEVVALHLNMYYSSDEYSAWEREHFHKGVKWFKDNIRDLKAVEGDCPKFHPPDIMPIREGFTHTFDNSHQNNRAKTYIEFAEKFNADLICSGRGAEDPHIAQVYSTVRTKSGGSIASRQKAGKWPQSLVVSDASSGLSILEGSGYNFIIPSWSLTGRLTLENSNQVRNEMSAKWSQREKLPEGLRNIITDCRCKGKQINCYWCNDLLINEVRSETGRELDDIVLKVLCAGRFDHLMDPKTWRGALDRNDKYKEVLGFDFSGDWPTFVKLEEEMCDRAKDMYARAGNI